MATPDTSRALWKPNSERDGNLVVLYPYKAGEVVIRDAETGEVLARGTSSGPSNGFQDTIRFSAPGARFRNVIVEDSTGRSIRIADGSNRHENIDVGEVGGAPSETGEGTPEAEGNVPGAAAVADPILVDPSIIQAPAPIEFPTIPIPDFQKTDPIEFTRRVGEFNRAQSAQNFETALERTGRLQQQELRDTIDFARGISAEQLSLLDVENAFARGERLEAAEAAIPGVQGIFERQRERAETLAQGRLLTDAEDRALELTARSTAADAASVRGFGDDSLVGQRQSELLSAQQRLGVQQVGESFLQSSVAQAAGLLFDEPTRPNIAARLPAQPPVPSSQLAFQQQSQENALSTISPATALSAEIQQEVFKTNIENAVNQFNATGVFNARRFNSQQEFEAIAAQAGIQISNAQAQNNFNQQVANQAAAEREAARLRQDFNRALDTFIRNRDRNQFIEAIGAIFAGVGGIENAPRWARKAVADAFGEEVANAIFGRPDRQPSRQRRPDRQRPPGESGGEAGEESGGSAGGEVGGSAGGEETELPPTEDPVDNVPADPEGDFSGGSAGDFGGGSAGDPDVLAAQADLRGAELDYRFTLIDSGTLLDSGIRIGPDVILGSEFNGVI